MRLRQLALAAHDLEPTLEALCDVLGIEVGFRDPGVGAFGLANGVMPVGDTFLEVVSPETPIRDVDVLGVDVDVGEEVLHHVAPVAMDGIRRHGEVLVQIEGDDV